MSRPDTVYTIYIASTPAKVFEALTTAAYSKQYFFGFAVECELKTGGAFTVRAPDGSVHIGGKVLECDPPHRLKVTWNVTWPGLVEKLGETYVTYDIVQAGDSVRLTITETHERDLPEDILSGGRAGWPAILSSLKSVLETGKPLSVTMEPPMKMIAALKAMGVEVPGG
ncbi:MAG: SRPBCC family protein [Pseudomonadota bacterium]